MAVQQASFPEREVKAKLKRIGYVHCGTSVRHVSAVLQSYPSLSHSFVEFRIPHNRSRTVQLIQLSGTIPVTLQGKSYNIPITIILQRNYPDSQPTVVVVPTENMEVDRNAWYIGADRKVSIPYLQSWKGETHDLTFLVQVLVGQFAAICPVYTVAQPPPPHRTTPLRSYSVPSQLGTLPRESPGTASAQYSPYASIHPPAVPPYTSAQSPSTGIPTAQIHRDTLPPSVTGVPPVAGPPSILQPLPTSRQDHSNTVKEMELNLAAAMNQIEHLRQSTSVTESENMALKSNITQLKRQSVELVAVRRDSTARLEDEQEHRCELEALIAAKDEEAKKLANLLREARCEIERYKSVCDSQLKELQENMAEFETSRRKIADLRTSAAKTGLEKMVLASTLEEQKDRMAALEIERVKEKLVASAQKETDVAGNRKRENEALQRELETLRKEWMELTQNNEKLKSKMQDLESELDHLKEQQTESAVNQVTGLSVSRGEKESKVVINPEPSFVEEGPNMVTSAEYGNHRDKLEEVGLDRACTVQHDSDRIATEQARETASLQPPAVDDIPVVFDRLGFSPEIDERGSEGSGNVESESDKETEESTGGDSEGESEEEQAASAETTRQKLRETTKTLKLTEKKLRKKERELKRFLDSFMENIDHQALMDQEMESLEKEKERLSKELESSNETVEMCLKEVDKVQEQTSITLAELESAREEIRILTDEDAIRSEDIISHGEITTSTNMLGTGAWGYVVEGTFRGKKVAVKCIHREIISEFSVANLQREITMLANLRHPNLVLFIAAAFDKPNAGPIILTELLGMSLRAAYSQQHINGSKLNILVDVAAALTYLHCRKSPVIHRDVSSANVLLEMSAKSIWKAKLSDFGSANLAQLATTPGPGAFIYAAPEVCNGTRSAQTTAIDVYSFGVLICEVTMATFPDQARYEELVALVKSEWPAVHRVMKECTAREPRQRVAMGTVLGHLEACLDSGLCL